jgi:cobalt-precorrin 5A hydrolase
VTPQSPLQIAGFGMRAGTGPASLRDALARTGLKVHALATIAERADLLRPLALAMGLPLRIVAVAGVATPTQSPRVQARFETGSVAEASALAAVGTGARLVGLRVTSDDGMATCAVARGDGI